MSEEEVEIKTHTALHVLKGAARKILGTKWTAGVYVNVSHGRLTLQCDRKPTEEEIKKIEELANRKIKENIPIKVITLDRGEAEDRYGDEIYDLFPIPPHIKELKIVIIEDWNINACDKRHTKTTGKIGKIKIKKIRFRKKKRLLEISYNIE